MVKKYSQSGLTLIETVLVMVVVLVAGGIVTTNRINHQQMLKRDALRKENIKTLSSKLEEFAANNKTYPSNLQDIVKQKLSASIPVDPQTHKSYSYSVTPSGCTTELINCTAYSISVKLENPSDKDADSVTQLITINGGQTEPIKN